MASESPHSRLIRIGLVSLLALGLCADFASFYFRIVAHNDNALAQVASYAQLHIPRNATVLADEPVGVMIPQHYCKLESAATCPDVTWIVTYESLTQKLPSQASDPQLYALLAHAKLVTVYTGFKETLKIYQVITTPSNAATSSAGE